MRQNKSLEEILPVNNGEQNRDTQASYYNILSRVTSFSPLQFLVAWFFSVSLGEFHDRKFK
jgi:hypothetical protein